MKESRRSIYVGKKPASFTKIGKRKVEYKEKKLSPPYPEREKEEPLSLNLLLSNISHLSTDSKVNPSNTGFFIGVIHEYFHIPEVRMNLLLVQFMLHPSTHKSGIYPVCIKG